MGGRLIRVRMYLYLLGTFGTHMSKQADDSITNTVQLKLSTSKFILQE